MPNIEGSAAAVRRLAERGCVRIGILDRPAIDRHDFRLQGFVRGLEAAGLPFDPPLIFPITDFTMAAGSTAARDIPPGAIDGLFCPTDAVAIGALRGLADGGIRVPDDVQVIGFDDLPLAEFITPRLTSVAPDHAMTADGAVSFLLERVHGKGPQEPREFVAPWRIRQRESTRSAPR